MRLCNQFLSYGSVNTIVARNNREALFSELWSVPQGYEKDE
jgi:hypothetical protein